MRSPARAHLDLLRAQGQLQPRRAEPVRAPGQRLRHRVRRRARPRARRGRRSGQGRVLRRRQDRGRDAARRSPQASTASTSSRRPSSMRLEAVAGRAGIRAPVSFRVNPDVDPRDAPVHLDGPQGEQVRHRLRRRHRALYRRAAAMRHVEVRGIDIHIGSQITELEPYREAATKILDLVDALRARASALAPRRPRRRPRHPLSRRASAAPVRVRARWCATSSPAAARRWCSSRDAGSSAAAGVLLTRVEYLKPAAAEGLRDRRRGDERPPAPVALRRLASGGRRASARGRRRACGRSSDRSARAAISSRTTATSRSPRATSWRSAPPAHTAT